MPFFLSEISSARAAYRLGSGSAKLSIHGDLLSDTVPSAQMSSVPGLRKKLSPIVEDDSAGTVRPRFSNGKRLKSGVQGAVGGASTDGPGVILKTTPLSSKPRPDTRGRHRLGVAGRHRKAIAVATEQHASALVLRVDVPGRAVERRLVE